MQLTNYEPPTQQNVCHAEMKATIIAHTLVLVHAGQYKKGSRIPLNCTVTHRLRGKKATQVLHTLTITVDTLSISLNSDHRHTSVKCHGRS